VRIHVCDDHRLFAEALSVVLRARGHDVGQPSVTPSDAVAICEREAIDVCVMDLGFPGGDGVDGIGRIREVSPQTHVVVLTGSLDLSLIESALAAGATTCVSKSERVGRIVDTIEIAPTIARTSSMRDVPWVRPRTAEYSRDERLIRFLTPREREVLERMVAGQATSTIAREMGVAYSTARTHIQSVLTKLCVHSKLEAVTFAARHGVRYSGPGGEQRFGSGGGGRG